MIECSIFDVYNSRDRHKIYVRECNANILDEIKYIENLGFTPLNIGKEIALFINRLNSFRYLQLDVQEFLVKLFDSQKKQCRTSNTHLLFIYNLGILLEPTLRLDAQQLLKEFSKTSALIILWENRLKDGDRLFWPAQEDLYFLDMSDLHVKKLHYAI